MTDFASDISAIQNIDAVPKILEVVCRTTGMGFAAIARVTESRWVCCAIRDEINFGLQPGGELKVETTLCHEIRQSHQAIVIDNVADDATYCGHETPALYGFKSYISMPIFLSDGTIFGTLCAIDPRPARLSNPETFGMFKLFAELIAFHLEALAKLASSQAELLNERKIAELREQFVAILGHDLRNPLASIAVGARLLRKAGLKDEEFGVLDLMQNSIRRIAALIENVMDFARARMGSGLILSRSPQNLEPVLKQVVAEIQSSAPEKKIDLKLDMNLPVHCDPSRIGQMLSNLVGNAIAYGAADKPILVTALTGLQQFELSVAIPAFQFPVLRWSASSFHFHAALRCRGRRGSDWVSTSRLKLPGRTEAPSTRRPHRAKRASHFACL